MTWLRRLRRDQAQAAGEAAAAVVDARRRRQEVDRLAIEAIEAMRRRT